jgi:hypothetical protein
MKLSLAFILLIAAGSTTSLPLAALFVILSVPFALTS